MIDNVIIIGVRRATNIVPEIEIRQMAGRSGRSYNPSDVGNVFFIVPKSDLDIAKQYASDSNPLVNSNMYVAKELCFHILPHVYSGDVCDNETACKWYSRSFSCFQGKQFDFSELYDNLNKNGMIEGCKEKFVISELGKISCKFYMRPERVFKLKQRVDELFASGYCENDFAWSWVLSYENFVCYVDRELSEWYVSNVKSLMLDFDNGDSNDGLSYYCILAGMKPKPLKYKINERKDDMMRILNAVRHICLICKYDLSVVDVVCKMFQIGVKYKDAKYMIENNITSKSKFFGMTHYE